MVKGDRNLFLAQSHLLLEVVFLMVIFHQFINSNHSDFPFEIIYCPCFLLLYDTIDIHQAPAWCCILDLGLTLLALNTISWFIYKHL